MGDSSTDAAVIIGIDSQRQHYIDWLRVLAVLLLFPFHVSRVFNAGQAFYLVGLPGLWLVRWFLILAGSVVGTFALYEVVRRVGPLRFLFGMRTAARIGASRRS